MAALHAPKIACDKEIRFAVVMYGGVSLAIYINGIAQELLSLVRSTAEAYEGSDGRSSLSSIPVQPADDTATRAQKLKGTERVYRKLSYLLADDGLLQEYKDSLKQKKSILGETSEVDAHLGYGNRPVEDPAPIKTRFVVDILSGTSAGGINAIFLAKALSNDQPIKKLKELWVEQGDIGLLLNDKRSLAGLNLDNQDPPKSLLNSRRMYLELLKAFDGMDRARASRPEDPSPYVNELDLFVTTTDIKGAVLPLQLSDKIVYEKRHRNVFHFKYGVPQEFGQDCNQFLRKYNPFLAFAARCTSSFPFAFEPMRLADLDELLESFGDADYRATSGSKSELWRPFFKENIDVAFNDNPVQAKGTLDVIAEVGPRPYADGGYLDNKPFSYATESLSHRQSVFQIERKLIYIEPSPEHPEDERQENTPPNVLINAKAALIDLPTYETIREDLQRVLQRNRTFNRIASIVEATQDDLEKSGRTDKRYDIKRHQWRLMDMDRMVEACGTFFLPYRRLRIASVTDDLATLIAKVKSLDERSDEFVAVRALLRAWRDKNYVEHYVPEDAKLVDQIFKGEASGKDRKPSQETSNALLDDFDFRYRFRRLNFVLGKIDFLTQLVDRNTPEPDEREYVTKARDMIRLVGSQDALTILGYLKSELTEIHKTLRTGVRKLEAGPEALQAQLNNPKPPLNRLVRPSLNPSIAEFYRAFGNLKLDEKQLKYVLGVPAEISESGDITLTSDDEQQFAKLDDKKTSWRAKELYRTDATLRSLLHNIAGALKAALHERIIKPTSDYCAELLDPASTLPAVVGNSAAERAKVKSLPQLSQELIRGFLYDSYMYFDDYDQIQFPIFYQTEFGESAEVDVFRISPEDAPSLINERGPESDGRRKLAGTALFHFGAFLDRVWRENDIMWGRLDGAERLITALMPDPDDKIVRDKLISDAHLAILQEEMPEATRLELSGMLSDALIRASSGEPFEEVLAKVMGSLQAPKVKQRLATAMRACIEDEKLLNFVKEHYEVNRELEPKPLLRSVARATQVTGKIFDDIAKAHRVESKSIQWIARAGQIFWGLVEVAVPGSIANLIFHHALKLIYMFEFLLILFGTVFTNPQVQQLGWLALAITVAVHTAQLILSDTMRGKHWWRYLIIGPATLFVFIVVALGIAAFIGIFFEPTAWNTLMRIQNWWANLDPPGRKALKVILLVISGLFVLSAFWGTTSARTRTRMLGLLPLALGLLMAGGTIYQFVTIHGLPGGLHMPGFAIEMATKLDDVQKVESIVGTAQLRGQVTLDFGFIGFYTITFLLFSGWLARRPFSVAKGLALVAAALTILTAGFDVLENFRLYAILDSATPTLLQKLHAATLLKWIFCFEATGILSLLFLSRKDYGYVLGLALLLMSMLGVLGLYHNSLLEFAFIGLGTVVFLMGLFIVLMPDRFRSTPSRTTSS